MHAIAIAIERDAEIRALRRTASCSACGRWRRTSLMLKPSGLHADRDDLGAEFLEHLRRHVVGGAVRAVEHDRRPRR